MFVRGGKPEAAPSQKTNPINLQKHRQKRRSIHELFGFRFFFTFFTACFVCVSFSMPNSSEPQLASDFKLPANNEAVRYSNMLESHAAAPELLLVGAPPIAAATAGSVDARAQALILSYAYTWDVMAENPYGDDYPNNLSINKPAQISQAYASETSDALIEKANGGAGLVVLDAGHGGQDPGSGEKGIFEKDIALEVTLLIADSLDEAGIDYILTRDSDVYVPIDRRIALSGADTAAFIVSVHCDWYKHSSICGTSTMYNRNDDVSKTLAALLQSYITIDLGTDDRSIHPRDDIALLCESQVPAVVVELAFISNKHDLSLLKTDEFKKQAAHNLVDGICEALNYVAP